MHQLYVIRSLDSTYSQQPRNATYDFDVLLLHCRVAVHAGVLLELLRQSVAVQMELSMQPQHEATLPREAIGDLLLIMVITCQAFASTLSQPIPEP